MRPGTRVLALAGLTALAACKSGSTAEPVRPGDITYHSSLAADDETPPPYDQAEIQRALIAERAAEATDERELSDAEASGSVDKIIAARDDLAVRRRFIRTLEICEAHRRLCPPRLDEPAWPYAIDSEADPKLDVPLRFDLESWQKVTAELHGRACACRTLTCVDSMFATLDRLETRPMPEVQADDTASVEISRARDCLYRLRGKKSLPRIATE